MDIRSTVEITLREAGYATWLWSPGKLEVTCFEDEALGGFVHLFTDSKQLLETWQNVQDATLSRYAPVLKAAGAKAWNIYSVFLAQQPVGSSGELRMLNKIEEQLQHTRKIVKAGLMTEKDVRSALLPLLPISSLATISTIDFTSRLKSKLVDLPPKAISAFLSKVDASEVVAVLSEPTS